MFPSTAAQWHAALNDFPAVLLILALLFDFVGGATKRESLRAAAFWALVVGAAGGVVALVSGLLAEATIEHGGGVHMVMERHKTMGIAITVLFVILAGWHIVRKGRLRPTERSGYLVTATIGALAVLWTAHLGGSIVYEYGGGVPTPVLQGALLEREVGHSHGAGTEHEHGEATPVTEADTADTHADPPGTPDHEHE